MFLFQFQLSTLECFNLHSKGRRVALARDSALSFLIGDWFGFQGVKMLYNHNSFLLPDEK
jgi:hypothetical protein